MARDVGRDLARRGAGSVVLTGSWVRGDAHPESDLDIIALGRARRRYGLERRGDFLVAVSWATPATCQAEFRDPARAGGAVPAWRRAVPLHDPHGTAQALRDEALGWTWEAIAHRCDAWVAAEVTGWAEEVHKLVANLALGRPWAAAAQRSLLALHLARAMAVHRRILWDSENLLWDLVGEAMGEAWRRAQGAALGVGGEDFVRTCVAARELYRLAATEVWPLLDDGQRPVVAHARELPIPGATRG